MEKWVLSYRHWRTGESRLYQLSQGGECLGETASSLVCPFDQTSLIFSPDKRGLFCPNCGEAYCAGSSQKDLVSVFAIKFEHLKFKPQDVSTKVTD
jgi:hypothetical protein